MTAPASSGLGTRDTPNKRKRKTPEEKEKAANRAAAEAAKKAKKEALNLLPQKHAIFQEWATSKGVTISPSITPANLPGRGIGLQATNAIPKDTQIIFVPEKAIFKPFPDDQDRNKQKFRRSQHANLAHAARNFWLNPDLKKWSDTWPSEKELRASLPLFWPKRLQELLPPSTLSVLQRQEADYKRDLKECLTTEGGELDYPWMIVNGRSFYWSPPRNKPGYMVLCPFMDYFNHGPEGTGVRVNQTAKGYEVVTDRDYAPGEELLLTYGAHSNDKLLVHYGFIYEPANRHEPHDDSILLDHVILNSEITASTIQSLSTTGYLGNYNLVAKTGRVCHRTQVAVRAMICAANEWEFFILNGEDMGRPRWKDVAKWLESCFDSFEQDGSEALKQLKLLRPKEVDNAYAVQLAMARWNQIMKTLQRRSQLAKGE